MEKVVSILLLLFSASCSPSAADTDRWKQYEETLVKITTDPEYTKLWPDHIKQFKDISAVALGRTQRKNTFPCQTYSSKQVPSSVHMLTPGDIKVVGAMGDSITAGNGINAWTPIGALTEFRGHSWSIGGVDTYEDVLTLPNILKNYNDDIKGFSTGTGRRGSSSSKLNVAYPGNVAENMPEQARMLVDRIKDMSDVDFENDWKLVTIFIGGNDLCDYCDNEGRYSPDNYRNHIREALDILQADLPRTFVNLVSIFDLTPMASLASNIICSAIHWAVCNCPREAEPGLIKDIAMQYSSGIEDLVNSGRYEGSDDFTVVFQPFMRDNDVPRLTDGKPDMSYFCPDCFHFSGKGHESIAIMLWNGMFHPVGLKKTGSSFVQDLYCPAEGEYLPTTVNSRSAQDIMIQNVAKPQVEEFSQREASPASLPIILGITGCVCLLLALALAAVIVYKKRQIPLEDLTTLTS